MLLSDRDSSLPTTFLIDCSTAFLFSAVVYTLSISRKPVMESIRGISEIGVSYAQSLSTSNTEFISLLVGVSALTELLMHQQKQIFLSHLLSQISVIPDYAMLVYPFCYITYHACVQIFHKHILIISCSYNLLPS